MKLGLIVSAILVAVFGIVLALSVVTAKPADAPTEATSPTRLAVATLPASLPPVVRPSKPAEAYGPLYDAAIGLYQEHGDAFERGQAPRDVAAALTRFLLAAAEAGSPSPGFLDKYIPVRPAAEPAFGVAFEGAVRRVLVDADSAWRGGRRSEAVGAALAVWALGERAFRDNVRLYPRTQGLQTIATVGLQLHEWQQQDAGPIRLTAEEIAAWGEAVASIEAAWLPKIEITLGVAPPIGDLVNLARHDQDRTFRVEATLRLGIHRYAPRGEANRHAIEQAIRDLMGNDDAMLAEAAKAADALTVEEMRRLH